MSLRAILRPSVPLYLQAALATMIGEYLVRGIAGRSAVGAVVLPVPPEVFNAHGDAASGVGWVGVISTGPLCIDMLVAVLQAFLSSIHHVRCKCRRRHYPEG